MQAPARGAGGLWPAQPPSPRGEGRAHWPGPRRKLALGGAVLSAALIALVLVVLLGGGSSSVRPRVAAHYGGLPSWLPKPRKHVGQVLRASVSRPALSVEGEAVDVTLAGGRVLARAVGPEVPEEGRFPVPPVTPATFIVTFADASGAIPLHASAFTFVDEHGGLHHPKMTAVGGGVPPAHTTPGRTVSVMLHDILPTGDGGLSWTPEGKRPIASWDFTVEID
jgi:hypothetical protein